MAKQKDMLAANMLPKEIVNDETMSDEAKLLLAALKANYLMNEKAQTSGVLYVANKFIIDYTGFDRMTLELSKWELSERKLITVEKGSSWKKGNSSGAATGYKLNFEALGIERRKIEKALDIYTVSGKSDNSDLPF